MGRPTASTSRSERHNNSSGWSLLFGLSAVIATLVFFQLDVTFILRTVSLCLLTLGLCTYVLYLCGSRVEALWGWLIQRREDEGRKIPELSEEELSNQQRLIRERSQNEHQVKVAKYAAEVAGPRQEAKNAQLEKEFYKFAGPAWKGTAQRLGDGHDDNSDETTGLQKPLPRQRARGTSKDASGLRRLPESVTRPSTVQPEPAKPEKRVIVLPEEPDAGMKECVTVAMRTLQSTIKRRRFLYTEKVQVLVDWMARLGYHPKLYTVCTLLPRRDLSQHVDQTLEDVQIVRDVMLVIEERDQ